MKFSHPGQQQPVASALRNLTRCRRSRPQLLRGSLARSVRDALPPPNCGRRPKCFEGSAIGGTPGPCHATTRPCSARGAAALLPLRRRLSRSLQKACPCRATDLPCLRTGAGARRRGAPPTAAILRRRRWQGRRPAAARPCLRGGARAMRVLLPRRRLVFAAAGRAAAQQPAASRLRGGARPGACSSRGGDSSSPLLAAPPSSSRSTLLALRLRGQVHAPSAAATRGGAAGRALPRIFHEIGRPASPSTLIARLRVAALGRARAPPESPRLRLVEERAGHALPRNFTR